MVKKVEPELPPLQHTMVEKRLRPTVDEEIVMRNTSGEAMRMWSPEAQHRRRLERKQQHDGRVKNAQHAAEVLAEHRLQELASMVAARTQDAVKVTMEQRKLFIQRWTTSIALASFLSRVREEVQLHRMDTSKMLQYVQRNQSRLATVKSSNFVKHAMHLNDALNDQQVQQSFHCIAQMFRYRKAVQAKRAQASIVSSVMMGWRNAGRVWKALLTYRQSVYKIQTWWRTVRKRLRDNRDFVARRWIKLERAELLAELNKSQKQEAQDFRKSGRKQTVRMMDEAERLRFIEHELRARRFNLLPVIDRWEEDRKSWQSDLDEWHATNAAYNCLGKSRKGLPMFRWPPIRPSYLPPRHIHEDGVKCSENCHGTKGDAIILEMWKRARNDPNDFTVIDCNHGHTDMSQKSGRMTRCFDNEGLEVANGLCNIYGPPPSTAEQQKFGGLSDLPGVHIQQMMPAMHGGEAKSWVLTMAAATSAEMVGFRPGTAEVSSPLGVSVGRL
jgi:hypothetical protein